MKNMKKAARSLWHYTVLERARSIVHDGAIRPAVTNVPEGERAAAWFTLSQRWEETANKATMRNGVRVSLSRAETHAISGLVRIGVRPEVAPYDWIAFRRLSGIDPRVAANLATVAKNAGTNLDDWRVSFEPVLAADWTVIECWDGAAWIADAGTVGEP
jgi:hypothetical protein